MMTKTQLQYNYNARLCRGLGAEMERLIEFADYMDKLLNYESREVAILRVEEIKNELNYLWDEQIKLFYEIQDDYKEMQRTTIADRMSVPARRAKHSPPLKDY